MKHIISRLMLVLGLIAIGMTRINSSATETEEKSCAYITACYSDNIEPREGDTFEITYGIRNGENKAQISVDAYDLVNNKIEIPLPVQTYEITDIVYTGSNAGIKSFGINSVFNSKSEDGTILYLAIGIKEVSVLQNQYVDLCLRGAITDRDLSSDNGHTQEELEAQKVEEENQLQAESKPKTTEAVSTTQSDVYEEDYGDDFGVEEQIPSGEEPKVEVYNTTENTEEEIQNSKDGQNSGILLYVELGIIVVIIIVIIVLLTKRNSTSTRR